MMETSTLTSSTKTLPGQDCYFYYYSSCSRGEDCPFRHEPLALSNETVCTYWRQGNCTKDHCIFRHLEVGNKKRNVTQCYWESQPQGCSKPHCPFLHQQPKDPVKQPLPSLEAKTSSKSSHSNLDSGSIIVNPAKLEKIQKIINIKSVDEDDTGVRRLLVPAGSGHIARQTITGGIKSRLGVSGKVKSRLGWDEADPEAEYDSEEEDLRKSAMKTIDLRGRIDGKTVHGRRVVETDQVSEDCCDDKSVDRKEKLFLREQKIQKLLKKQEMEKLLYKAEKKAKKKEKERMKSQVSAVLNNVNISKKDSRRLVSQDHDDLPSASDYSDLESPHEDDGTLSVISRTDRGGTLQSDLAVVGGKTSAKMRLGPADGDRRYRSGELEQSDLRRRMKDKRDKIERQSYAARVLGDLMGGSAAGSGDRKVRKRTSDQMKDESDEERIIRKRSLDHMKMERDDDEERKVRKRTSDQMKREHIGGDEVEERMTNVRKEKEEDSPVKHKKKKKVEKKERKEKREKKSKKSKKEMEDNLESDKNALQMVQEYEPIRSRKIKIQRNKDVGEEIKAKELSLDSSHDAVDQELAATEDVLKDLDDFLND